MPHFHLGAWGVWHRSLVNYRISLRESIFALIVGVITAIAAITFKWLINLVSCFPPGPWTVALGGLIVGFINCYLLRNVDGTSIPGVITSVFKKGGHIPGRVAFIRMVSSAITIGSGGSAGKEGPIVQIGASLGSKIAQILHLGEHRMIILLACGVAAGISSAFNAPMAGIFFALEIILARFNYHAFCLIVISSLTSCLATRYWLGNVREFSGFSYSLHSDLEIGLFIGLGLWAGIVGVSFVRSLVAVEDLFAKLPIPQWSKPALGGLICGLLAVFWPQIRGGGFAIINQALRGELAFELLVTLLFIKIVATSFTLGSGGSGGDLAPSLFIGAMLGGVYGSILHFFFPEFIGSYGVYAIVGMASVFAASTRSPITSIFMILETCSSYQLLLPLLTSTVIACLVASILDRESIYTLKLSRDVINKQSLSTTVPL